MKHFILTIFFTLLTFFTFSQNLNITDDIMFNSKTGFYQTFDLNGDTEISGNRFLFETFKHSGILIPNNDNNRYLIKDNINIDLANKHFVSKISKDTIFIFSNLSKVIINNATYLKKGNKILIEKFKNKEVALYQDISKYKTKPVKDPVSHEIITNSKWDQVHKKFYLLKKSKLIKIKLNKKSILKQFTNKQALVKIYVKKNKLNYKNIDDIVKIFNNFK
jgi:hypothetical protein